MRQRRDLEEAHILIDIGHRNARRLAAHVAYAVARGFAYVVREAACIPQPYSWELVIIVAFHVFVHDYYKVILVPYLGETPVIFCRFCHHCDLGKFWPAPGVHDRPRRKKCILVLASDHCPKCGGVPSTSPYV